jgi:hypothetical protein
MAETVKAQQVQPESAPSSVPKDPVERSKWYQQMRNRLGQSRFKVGKMPAGFTPYWARKDDAVELSRLDSFGFKVVHDDPKAPRYLANGLREDGTYVLGDVILLECPTEYYEFYKEENRDRAKMLVDGVPTAFINEAGKKDVPAFIVEEKKNK